MDGRIGWMDKRLVGPTDINELANDNDTSKPREHTETQPSYDNIPENYLDKNTAGISQFYQYYVKKKRHFKTILTNKEGGRTVHDPVYKRFKTSLTIFSEIYEQGVVPPGHFALGQNLFILIKFKKKR